MTSGDGDVRRVWIDDWQMQCCGEPFRVGEQVRLSTTADFDRDYLHVVLGADRADALTDYEDHHALDDGPMSPLVGTVLTIEAVSCRYELRGRTLYPVTNTTHTVHKDEATGWEPETDDVHLVGYVVAIQLE